LVEYLVGSPFIDEIAAGGWKLDSEGYLPIPAGPGLGIEIDPESVARYSGAKL
jgi:L-alanine-DL-glutamate epimerase-like enolase superfamily enzyme